jgi:hypothetical protein
VQRLAARMPMTTEARWSLFILPAAAALSGVVAYLTAVQSILFIMPVVLFAPVIIWKRPYYAIIFLLATALVIEQFTYSVGTHNGVFTDRISWWRTIVHSDPNQPAGSTQGMIVFPVEIFLILVLTIWILKAGLHRSFGLPKSPILTCMKIYWVLLIVAVGIGLTHGAQLKFDLWELRSWIYITVAFILAAALLQTTRAFDLILWTIVVGSGFKGILGTYIFFRYARAMEPRPEAILGHEEAFFFGIFIVLACALWLYDMRGPLRTTATGLLPFVVIADMANARRTAWLIIAVSMVVLLVICFRTLPRRRKFVVRAFVVMLVGGALYLPAYWNHDGTLAQPARAVRSQFQPSSRDQASDLYRQQENLNLLWNVKSAGVKGSGFGVPISYSGITNISNIDPMIAYIPHNGLLWIWLRLGLQGEIVFWCMCAVALVRATRLAMAKDRRLAMFGALVTCAIVSYLVDGYEDMGLAEYRIAITIGCLLGAMEVATRFVRAQELTLEPTIELRMPTLVSVPVSASS